MSGKIVKLRIRRTEPNVFHWFMNQQEDFAKRVITENTLNEIQFTSMMFYNWC